MNKGYQVGYKGIDIELINYTKNPAKIMWDMLKQTWITLQDIEYDVNNPVVEEFIQGSLDKKLNPVPQETIMIQAIFKNISRVNLAQLTRHRGWVFQSESQMPQSVKHNILIPLNIVNSEYYERAKKLVEDSQALYDDMIKGNENKETTNIPYQDARYLLLHGQTANISASFSLPLLVSATKMRFDNNINDEINYSLRILVYKLRQAINNDDELDELDKRIYNQLLNGADAHGANFKKGVNHDALFGNSFKRYPDASESVTEVTKNADMDFTKLAWYDELKRIKQEEPHLLLDNEEQMIDSWDD